MRGPNGVLICVAVGLAAAAIFATSAQAEVAFSPATTLAGNDSDAPQVVVDYQGRATVLWEEMEPRNEYVLVRATRIDPSGLPGPILTLAAVPNLIGQCVCPGLTIDSSGR